MSMITQIKCPNLVKPPSEISHVIYKKEKKNMHFIIKMKKKLTNIKSNIP